MKKLTILFLFFLSVQFVFSQTEKKTGTSATIVTETPAENPAVNNILKNLQRAREIGDMAAKSFWENKLHEITKPQVLNEQRNDIICVKETNSGTSPTAMNLSNFISGEISSNCIARDRISGDLYAAVVQNGFGVNADTLKVFRSTDNGLTFSLIAKLFANGFFLITANSLDIEAISKGDSSFAFVSYSFNSGGVYSSSIYRVRQDGLSRASYIYGNSANKFRSIRITSDNARYVTGIYIYAIVTLDSTAGGVRRLKNKLYIMENPFAWPFNAPIPIITGYQNPAGGYYAYNTLTAPDTAKMESDIAFVNTTNSNDYLCTVTIIRGVPGAFGDGKNLYFSKGSGYVAPGLFNYTDTKLKENPRIAATGWQNNSAIVATRRLFGGTDWDAYCFSTTDISTAVPVFFESFIEPPPATDVTLGVSVTANYRSNSSYMFAYNTLVMGGKANIFTRPYNNFLMGTLVKSNPDNSFGSDLYGYPDAGFRNVNNDSCLVIWGGYANTGSTVTGGCSGPFIGVNNNNSTVEGYYLAQNYPNPFNPSTSIAFEIKDKGFVTLKVYDVLGNEVMQLVNEKKEAGSHVVQFDAGNLPSGTYFYKITTDKFSDVKKMVLVK